MLDWLQGQLTISRGLFDCSQREGERFTTLSLSRYLSDFCQNIEIEIRLLAGMEEIKAKTVFS